MTGKVREEQQGQAAKNATWPEFIFILLSYYIGEKRGGIRSGRWMTDHDESRKERVITLLLTQHQHQMTYNFWFALLPCY